MAKIRLINGRQARMIEATISLPAEELARLLSANITDRRAAMVQQHGEACTKTTAAKILSCSTQTVTAMLRDGRIKAACGGERVDVRSLADYIENRGEYDYAARQQRKGRVNYV